MSECHPIIAITGSSGAGTSTVTRTFQHIFRREGVKAAVIGVVPTINLEWIQKLIRDKSQRGYSQDAVVDTILRRMPDYVHYIVPQFGLTHVNFQRVPVVDTSNPFITRDIPTADESVCVVRFAQPKGIDFQYLLSMINGSWMSRANTIVVPGGKMELTMQLIFTPFIWRMMERKKRALGLA